MQTKPCPKCGKQSILRETGMVLSSYPAQRLREWWCACGHREQGPVLREITEEEFLLKQWERANAVSSTPISPIR
jgi:predicted RNA-binding Zn-ribbon protein involved in translation (DUF1610 family)